MITKEWIRAALIRALKTVAQTAVATIGTTAAINQVDWKLVASASVLAGILSLLTSIAGLPEVNTDDATALAEKPELPDDYFEEEAEEDE